MVKTDNDIIQIFLPIINNALVERGFENVIVQQAYQPKQQGIPTQNTVYFFKVSGRNYGYPGRFNRWDSVEAESVHTESQYQESTWQVMALVMSDVEDVDSYGAADLLLEVSSIMQSDTTLSILNDNGIGVLKINNIINPFFVDDRDNFEASPSFDFVLTYENSRDSVTPIVSQFVPIIKGV